MKFLLSVLASVVANILVLLVRPGINVWRHLFTDVPKIKGRWRVTVSEPGRLTPQKLEVELNRFGRSVYGEGNLVGKREDPFTFTGEIRRQAFFGTFRRKKSRVLAGTGTFLLKILADDKSMTGHCNWYDKDLDNTWTSGYEWEMVS